MVWRVKKIIPYFKDWNLSFILFLILSFFTNSHFNKVSYRNMVIYYFEFYINNAWSKTGLKLEFILLLSICATCSNFVRAPENDRKTENKMRLSSD